MPLDGAGKRPVVGHGSKQAVGRLDDVVRASGGVRDAVAGRGCIYGGLEDAVELHVSGYLTALRDGVWRCRGVVQPVDYGVAELV